MGAERGTVYRFSEFSLDIEQRELRRGDQALALRSRAFDLLTVLVANAGELMSKDALLEQAWPGVIVEENNLQVQVSALRKLLGPEAIRTVPGWGYRFGLPVLLPGTAPPAGTVEARTAVPEPPRLIGREADIAELLALLGRERVVTVLGAGGIGKTRIAQTVARQHALASAHDVLWVELASLSDPALLPAHVAAALGVTLAEGQGGAQQLAALLPPAAGLLVLDNAEHLLDAVAAMVQTLLQALPQLRVLLTSQAPLHIRAEYLHRLAALPVAPQGASLDEAAACPAVALLQERVRMIDPAFALDAANIGDALALCRRLDGVPLAIELAAARVPLMGLQQLLAQLDQRLQLLRASLRDVPARQQTLGALLDWSHRLLSAGEQAVFRRLGALPNGFSLEQARVLAAGPDTDEFALLDAMAVLIERSLLLAETSWPTVYRMPESVRSYALLQLQAAAEHEVIARAAQISEAAADEAMASGRAVESLARLGVALELCALLPEGEARDERELAIDLRMGPAIQSVLGPAHPRCEAVYRRARDLARRAGPSERGFQALWGYWHFLCMRGSNREAAALTEDILKMAAALGDEGLELEAQHAVMTTQDLLGNAPATLASAEKVLALYRPELHHHLSFAYGAHDPGVCAYGQGALAAWLTGRPDRALAMADSGITLANAMSDGYSRATGYFYAGILYAWCGSSALLAHAVSRLLALSVEYGMEMLLTEARLLEGYLLAGQGKPAEGLGRMLPALAAIEEGGDLGFVLIYIALAAEALVADGRTEEAVTLLERGMGHAIDGQQELFLPELYRLRGCIRQCAGDTGAAAADWQRAVSLADTQGAPSLGLRATISAAQAGEPGALPALLARLAGIDGGHTTRDLQAARAVCEAAGLTWPPISPRQG